MIMTSTKSMLIEMHQTTVMEASRMLNTTVESSADLADLNDRGARTNIMAVKEKPMKVYVKKATQGSLLLLTLLMIAGGEGATTQQKKKNGQETVFNKHRKK